MVIRKLHIPRRDLSDLWGTQLYNLLSKETTGHFRGYKRCNYLVFLHMCDMKIYRGGKYLCHHHRSLLNIQLNIGQCCPQQARRSLNPVYRSNIYQHLRLSPHPDMFHTTHHTVGKQLGMYRWMSTQQGIHPYMYSTNYTGKGMEACLPNTEYSSFYQCRTVSMTINISIWART
jgi:hypothetical protein